MSPPTVALRLDAQTRERLARLAAQKDRSPHYLMKRAVEKFLEQEEAEQKERALTQSRWESFALTGEVLTHNNMKNWADNLGE